MFLQQVVSILGGPVTWTPLRELSLLSRQPLCDEASAAESAQRRTIAVTHPHHFHPVSSRAGSALPGSGPLSSGS